MPALAGIGRSVASEIFRDPGHGILEPSKAVEQVVVLVGAVGLAQP